MSKRHHVGESLNPPLPKRARTNAAESETDRLSLLSNEILLHILSFLPIPSLLTCQRLSHRFHSLAGDSELWKRQYYSKWVRPRARRLAITRRAATLPQSKFEYSPKVSTWLDHGHLDRKDRITNWKRQYQLRHNWSKGICRVTQIEFSQRPQPPMLVAFCAGFVFTTDSHDGLRAWSAESPKSCIASVSLTDSGSALPASPTALTATSGPQKNSIEVVVGFEDGHFSVYRLDSAKSRLDMGFSRAGSVQGAITAMASSFPYLMVVSKHKVLSLYKLPVNADDTDWLDKSHLLASLKADSILSPMSLSVRVAGSEIIASIVYSFFHIGCGWSLGIQELHFDKNGQQTISRLATTVDSQYGMVPLHHLARAGKGQPSVFEREETFSDLYTRSLKPTILHQDPPTSVSYSHPYLLTSHADNTLTVYLVVSTATELFVKGGQRLWGHTSSVSAVQVSDRGKAVSISSHGDEVRIWELEALISSFGSHRVLNGDKSIRVNPGKARHRESEGFGVLPGLPHDGMSKHQSSVDISDAMAQMRDCIGFDDERLLLLREREYGAQLLEFYDFT
ncbi:hypothetical protein ARAM_005891 [Aspergillus rambellii]|uniref:Probable E3 ubiquitin ligase complex SCF subunit sconB n=1 Tax=Aspergillus rambellii TaxID=308745 RepID=A0A0F8XGZ2_9EURO|nr:hypothetical protein ARAM_005891 [Aspergillus rambellii]